jgi:gliding motility-associated-like protein
MPDLTIRHFLLYLRNTMPRKYLIYIFLFALATHQKVLSQQIVNGNFDGQPLLGVDIHGIVPQSINNEMVQNQSFLRLLNFSNKVSPPYPDSIMGMSQGIFGWAYFDSTDQKMFMRNASHPSGFFRDFFMFNARSQFNKTPFHNRMSLCFVHDDLKTWELPYKYGYSSLKLSINYTSNLTVGKKYLLTLYDMALDSIGIFAKDGVKTMIEDSLFIGNALNDYSIGDTIAICHPQRGVWNKRFIPFTPTKPYTHFTVGNYSAESANIAANMIDECYIFSILATSADTLWACPGDSVKVTSDPLMHKTEWHDGDTSTIKYISQSGWNVRYSYPDGNAVIIDSFFLLSAAQFTNFSNITVCENQSLVLKSSYQAPSSLFAWSTGDITSSITTLAGNTIWCQTHTGNGCTITDSFLITRVPAITVQLSADSILCYGQTKTIGIPPEPGLFYLWNTNDTLPRLTIQQTGKYTLTVSNQYCSDSATINITAKGLIRINLPTDTVFCFDDLKTLLLDVGDEFTNYLWKPTGERTSSIYATMPQKYIVQVKDSSNCDGGGSTLVSETCPEFVFVPNAFTPNGDGLNDVFLPQTRNLSYYQLSIVNRWGEIVFTTKNPQQGWDGKDAQADVYVVLINYKVDGKTLQSVKQNVSLLR